MDKAAVPEHWDWVTLGDLGKFQNGYGFSKDQWSEQGLPIIRIQNLTGTGDEYNHFQGEIDNKYHVHKGDILLSWSATLDVFRWKGEHSVLNQHIYNVYPYDEPETDKDFIYWLLQQVLDEIRSGVHGSTMKHITKSELLDIEVPRPPLSEQRAIVAKLESIHNKIQESHEAQEEAEKIEEELIYSIFLNLVDETDAEDIQTGGVIEESQYGISEAMNERGEGYPILRMGNYDSKGRMDYNKLKHVDISEDELKKYILEKGDVLFNRTNSKKLVGKTAVYDGRLDEAVFASYLIRVYLDTEKVLPEYFVNYLNSPRGRTEIDKKSKQAVSQANINSTELREMDFELPSKQEQKSIITQLRTIEKRINEIQTSSSRKSEILEQLPKSILNKAFHGELVEDIQQWQHGQEPETQASFGEF